MPTRDTTIQQPVTEDTEESADATRKAGNKSDSDSLVDEKMDIQGVSGEQDPDGDGPPPGGK